MKVVIVEDEIAASENLNHLLKQVDATITVIKVLDTVKSCVVYFSESNDIDLIFMDIHLADGISFEIFDQIELTIPIIFTTAYNEYALKAFKVNSIDYILKPVLIEELTSALNKFKKVIKKDPLLKNQVEEMLRSIQLENKIYKSNYLFNHRDELIPVKAADIAYFYIDTGIIKAVTFQNKVYTIDRKLEDLETELNPTIFDRANRQFIINRNAITRIKYYFGGKLIVQLQPISKDRIVISKTKAPQFKKWVNN